jgi:hypothetical protein
MVTNYTKNNRTRIIMMVMGFTDLKDHKDPRSLVLLAANSSSPIDPKPAITGNIDPPGPQVLRHFSAVEELY